MPSHFNKPKKIKEKASIPIVKFTGFSVPLCYHAHSPGLFIFEALTPSNPDILTFLAEKLPQKYVKDTMLFTAYCQTVPFEIVDMQHQQLKANVNSITSGPVL